MNNSLVLNAMAKTYSKTPKTDAVQLTINALFANTFATGSEMHEKSQYICENLLIFLKRLVNGHRFKKKHFEDLYSKALEKSPDEIEDTESTRNEIRTEDDVSQKQVSEYNQKTSHSGSDKKSTDGESTLYGEKLAMVLDIISIMLSKDINHNGSNNFIYFNGYNSGISTFKNSFEKNPFSKVF